MTINSGAGDDEISNLSDNVSISSGKGNDDISNHGVNYVSINAGAGNDTVRNYGDNVSVSGGKGADILYGGSGKSTLWGGAGNDSLYGGSGEDVFIYKPGEGTDKIFNYANDDMLQILNADGTNGSFSKSKFSGGVLTLTISGGGSVVFENVSVGDQININGTTRTINGSKLK